MSKLGRSLNIGDMCTTNFSGNVTLHKVVKKENGKSQSGILLIVEPDIPRSSGGWVDADWFEPANITRPSFITRPTFAAFR